MTERGSPPAGGMGMPARGREGVQGEDQAESSPSSTQVRRASPSPVRSAMAERPSQPTGRISRSTTTIQTAYCHWGESLSRKMCWSTSTKRAAMLAAAV